MASDLIGRSDARLTGLAVTPAAMEVIERQARITQGTALPSALEAFRTPFESFATRVLALEILGLNRSPAQLNAFSRASAVSDSIGQSLRVDRDLLAATSAFRQSEMPAFDTLASYRGFYDAAGLSLPRWPRMRLLSLAEKQRRFEDRLQRNAESVHVKKAKSLVHQYESVLREILDAAMVEEYGEDWMEARLPRCNCGDLLGRWRKRGGNVLHYADFAHYARIMCHPEHFETVFEAGFEDRGVLEGLLAELGRLRAASHHGRAFSPEDLRDMRLMWRTIKVGLLVFTPDVVVESWG